MIFMTDVETNKLVTTTSYLPNSLYVIMRRLSRQHITTIELSCEDVGCVPENSATMNQSMKTCKSSSLICDRLASVLFSQRRDRLGLGGAQVPWAVGLRYLGWNLESWNAMLGYLRMWTWAPMMAMANPIRHSTCIVVLISWFSSMCWLLNHSETNVRCLGLQVKSCPQIPDTFCEKIILSFLNSTGTN